MLSVLDAVACVSLALQTLFLLVAVALIAAVLLDGTATIHRQQTQLTLTLLHALTVGILYANTHTPATWALSLCRGKKLAVSEGLADALWLTPWGTEERRRNAIGIWQAAKRGNNLMRRCVDNHIKDHGSYFMKGSHWEQ